MKESKLNDHSRNVRTVLGSLMRTLEPSGVEFVDIQGAASCRFGQPLWRESKARRARRARQEMGILRKLDEGGAIVPVSEIPDLLAWESRLDSEGYQYLSHRVGDRGVLHAFFVCKKGGDWPLQNHPAVGKAAEEIERLLDC